MASEVFCCAALYRRLRGCLYAPFPLLMGEGSFLRLQHDLPEELALLHALVRAARILQRERLIQHGRSLPAKINAITCAKSARVPIVDPRYVRCLANM